MWHVVCQNECAARVVSCSTCEQPAALRLGAVVRKREAVSEAGQAGHPEAWSYRPSIQKTVGMPTAPNRMLIKVTVEASSPSHL